LVFCQPDTTSHTTLVNPELFHFSHSISLVAARASGFFTLIQSGATLGYISGK
jgi:hypothetical protein